MARRVRNVRRAKTREAMVAATPPYVTETQVWTIAEGGGRNAGSEARFDGPFLRHYSRTTGEAIVLAVFVQSATETRWSAIQHRSGRPDRQTRRL